MSAQLINRSPDLRRLRDEGYDLEVAGSHLLIHQVPYVTRERKIATGTLASPLELSGEKTVPPRKHVAYFRGETPCDSHGAPLTRVLNNSTPRELGGFRVDHTFSAKPVGGNRRYADHAEKLLTYIALLGSPARELDPSVTAQIYPVVLDEADEDPVFMYRDTASSRAGIEDLGAKLAVGPVAIIGLGGTGSYILDLIAKTPVSSIHLFDGDRFIQHNAFRAPGAATLDDLRSEPLKVDYLKTRYEAMHRGIVAHPHFIDESNVAEVADMAFVFLALDAPRDKGAIIEQLERSGTPYVDVGMGIDRAGDALSGILRVTGATSTKHDHVRDRVSLEGGGIDDYDSNIQVADLNALSAALAVIWFKKQAGFYEDEVREHNYTYVLAPSKLHSEDFA